MLATAVARYLDEQGVAEFDETGTTGNTFINLMPATPDRALAISHSGGNPTNSHDGYDEPVLQFRARDGQDPRPAYDWCREVYEALVGLHAVTLSDGVNDFRIIRTTAQQSDPASMGADSNDRHEYVANFAFRVRALTAHRV